MCAGWIEYSHPVVYLHDKIWLGHEVHNTKQAICRLNILHTQFDLGLYKAYVMKIYITIILALQMLVPPTYIQDANWANTIPAVNLAPIGARPSTIAERTTKIEMIFSKCLGLTQWGRLAYICVGNVTIIGSNNGLSPGRRQAIIWTNARTLLIGPLGTKLSEILIGIYTFSVKKMHLKMSFAKWRPFCHGLNVQTSSFKMADEISRNLAALEAL